MRHARVAETLGSHDPSGRRADLGAEGVRSEPATRPVIRIAEKGDPGQDWQVNHLSETRRTDQSGPSQGVRPAPLELYGEA